MRIDPASVYVKDTGTARGRGAFATRSFKAGEIVETCPVVVINEFISDLPPEVGRIVFGWSYLVTRQVGRQTAIVLGYGSLYNHANPSSMRYEADGQAQVMRFIAVRDIAADEELTVNYNAIGGGSESNENSWFGDKRITPI